MAKIKIMVDSNIPLLEKAIGEFAEIKIFDGRKLTNKQLIDFGCEILFVRSTSKINSELLGGSKVKIVATATSGSEHFDKDYLDRCGIKYFDAIGSNALSVAEHCIFGILHWAREKNIDIRKKSIGIIGFGNVGRRLAYFAKSLGLEVFINDPPLFDNDKKFPSEYIYLEKEEIVRTCDIISTHTPLTKFGKYRTVDLIDSELVSRIKHGGLLLHASRGTIVSESAWSQAASQGKIDAIVDVWENEPSVDAAAVRSAMIATPHIAGHSYDAKLKGSLMMAKVFEQVTGIKPNYGAILLKINSAAKRNFSDVSSSEVYDLIASNRNLLNLSQRFKAVSALPNSDEAFDEFRNNYPIEREAFEDF